MTDIRIGRFVRVYLRADANRWEEFIVQGVSENGDPIAPNGRRLSMRVWQRHRTTYFRESQDGWMVFRHRTVPRWRRRVRVARVEADGWLLVDGEWLSADAWRSDMTPPSNVLD